LFRVGGPGGGCARLQALVPTEAGIAHLSLYAGHRQVLAYEALGHQEDDEQW
jgi:hypothetical protein